MTPAIGPASLSKRRALVLRVRCNFPVSTSCRINAAMSGRSACMLQVEYQGRTLYNCGVNNYPKDYTTDPACTALPPSSLRDQLKLQRSVTEWPWEAVALVCLYPYPTSKPYRACSRSYVALRREANLLVCRRVCLEPRFSVGHAPLCA